MVNAVIAGEGGTWGLGCWVCVCGGGEVLSLKTSHTSLWFLGAIVYFLPRIATLGVTKVICSAEPGVLVPEPAVWFAWVFSKRSEFNNRAPLSMFLILPHKSYYRWGWTTSEPNVINRRIWWRRLKMSTYWSVWLGVLDSWAGLHRAARYAYTCLSP